MSEKIIKRFAFSLTWVLGFLISCLVAQLANRIAGSHLPSEAIVLIVPLLFLMVSYKYFREFIATPYGAISILLLITIGTALGTFILQHAPRVEYVEHYGAWGKNIIYGLGLDDVFHSWWYVGLYILLAWSLLKSSLSRSFSKATFAFHLAHLSPVLILIGFWTDYYFGFRGMIDLEIGDSTNLVSVYDANNNFSYGNRELGFDVTLDTFFFEKYEPEYRVQLWENQSKAPSHHGSSVSDPNLVTSFPLEIGKIHRIYGTDTRFRVIDFYPNFEFQFSYPENIDTIEALAPGVVINLKTSVGENTLQLRSDRPGQSKLTDPSLGTSLEFYWDPEPEELLPLESPSVDQNDLAKIHSGMAGFGKIVFSGKQREILFIREEGVTRYPMEKDRFYRFSPDTEFGFTFKFLFPDAALMKAIPGTKNEELENPVGKVEVWSPEINPYQTAFIYPGMMRSGGSYSIPNSDYFLAFESIKQRETKFYNSRLSIIDSEGNILKSGEILVNEPLHYKGYRFYQSNYDPRNPSYSGIGVSYNPGLYPIYLGFILMVGGIIWMFYFRKQDQAEELTENKKVN